MVASETEFDFRESLRRGLVIPAHPLALTPDRRLDERCQRALSRYYLAAGAGGLAVGVHTTQFAIRAPRIGLFEPVLSLAAEEMRRAETPIVRIGGICGETRQAVSEAELLHRLGYHAGLLSLGALRTATEAELISHVRAVAEVIPVIGFYLQPAVGGRVLSWSFWRKFVELDQVVAIKIAAFNRYQTQDVIRAVCESGRTDIALYTGNDDNIVADLLTPYRFSGMQQRFVGGLLGHWSVWTKSAAAILRLCHQWHAGSAAEDRRITRSSESEAGLFSSATDRECLPSPQSDGDFGMTDLLRLGVEVTDCNAAFFDVEHQFRGCIAGLHEVLRRQGLMQGTWCLDEQEALSPGQREEIDRVYAAYPHLNDDTFVAEHRDSWLSG